MSDTEDAGGGKAPGVPKSLAVFTPSSVLQRSNEHLNRMNMTTAGWPSLPQIDSEESLAVHRIERTAESALASTSSASQAQLRMDTSEGSQKTPPTSAPNDGNSKKRPRLANSPESLSPEEKRRTNAMRGIKAMRALVDNFSGWMADVPARAISREAADEFWGMVNFLRDSCEDVTVQMAFLEGRVAESRFCKFEKKLKILLQN